jgi:hypothetical protein
MDFPKLIPRTWLGPRRNQATQGDHRHIIGDDTTGYISAPLFNGEAPADTDELVALLEQYGLDGSSFVGGGGGGPHDHDTDYAAISHTHTHDHDTSYAAISHSHSLAFATRSSVTITTASLADEAVEDDEVTIAAAYRLMTIDVDNACRVRLYKSSAARSADAARPVGTDVDIATDHGLIFEYVATAAIAAMLSPLVDGFCPTGSDVYYAIQNLSGGTTAIEVTFDFIRTE